jgi:hypothetical protein
VAVVGAVSERTKADPPPSVERFSVAFTSSYETEILVCVPSVISLAAIS